MHIPRLLFRFLIWLGVLIASLLVLLWAAPAAAQSTSPRKVAPARPPLLSQPPLSDTIPSWDGRTRIPLPVPQAKGGGALKQAQPAQNWNGPRQFQMAPGVLRRFQLLQPQAPGVLFSRNPESNNQRCYTVREYRFQRDNSASDATTFKDYHACEPSTQFRLRAAAAPTLQGIPVPNRRPDPAIERCGFAYGSVCPAIGPVGPPIVR